MKVAQRTAQRFSAVDCISWLQDLSVAYQMNWREKLAALEAIEYTNHSVSSVLGVWERRPQGADGNGLVPVTKKILFF